MISNKVFEQEVSLEMAAPEMGGFTMAGGMPDFGYESNVQVAPLRLRQSEADAQQQLMRLSNAALAAIDDDARAELDGDYLSSDEAMLDQDGSNYLMGAELAKLLVGGDAYAAAESLIEKMPEAEREAARVRLNSCGQEADGCRLVGELWRKQVRGQYAEQQAKIHAADVILQKKMDSYVSGAAMATGEDDAEDAMSAAELAQLSEVMDKKALADARAVREWMETYVRPLDGAKDAEYMMRNLDSLEDELYGLIGDDEARAGMAYQALMHWAEQVQKSGKVGVRDEFVVAVGKKLSNWGRAHLAMPMISMAPVGSPDAAVSMTPEQVAAFNEVRADYERKTNSRAMLRAAINKSMEAGEDTGFWVKSARSAARMAGDSLLYFLPGNAGMVAGSLDTILRGFTEGYDEMRLNGLSGSEAAGQTLIDTGIQTAVELMPWGRIGGSGLSGFLRKAAGKSAEKPGAFTRWLVKHTQQSTVRALVAEGVSNVVDEAILEPIAGGLMTYGAERTFDLLGVPHGPSRGWAESFDELAQIWGDPSQLAGLVIFSAGIGGASAPRIRENVKWFARTRTMWEAEGLTAEQVDDVMASEDPLAEGTRLVNDGWKNDPVGMRKRIVENNRAIKERGEVLVLTGQGAMDAALANDELAAAYAGVWRAYAENGVLPHVEATGDGKVHITKKDRFGKGNDVDLVLSAEDADAYLIHEFEEVEKRWLKERQRTEGASAERPDLRGFLMRNVSEVAGGAMLREAAEKKAVRVEDVTRYLPEELGALVKKQGGINRVLAERISEWARGMIDGLMADGASEAEARRSRDYAEGAVMSLGDMESFARNFALRGEVGQLTGDVQTSLFRYRGGMERVIDGKKILGSTLFGVPGRATAFNAVEDVAESMLDEVVRARALVLAGDGQMSDAVAEGKAWVEMAAQVARAREAVLKADPKLVIPVPDGAKPMSVIEAFSAMAMSKFILSSATPGWMKPMVEAMKANLTAAAAVDAMGRAWAAAAESDPEALGSLADVLDKVGVRVADALSETRIEQADVVAWTVASGIVMSHVNGPDGAGGMPVSKVVADADEEEQAILEHEAPPAEETVEEAKQESARAAEQAERLMEMQAAQGANAPEEMRGVFDGDNCAYNAAGGYWFGMIQKSKLVKSTEQVKVGTKGKHGVIAGRELTGNFQASAAPLYVWMRSNGELWLISGRHRYELMMRDNGVESHPCYVFREDAEHDEKWARMMDYENNMRDDQADELTAGTYVRETGLSDAELEVRGLMRNESRSKRGALIGRHAREELWTRFSNGKIKAKDAEVICNLTRYIKDQSRVDEIQRRCCMLLDNGKSWDYIGGMVQLMVQAELEQGQQGWFNFGADFEAALERAATWIEKALKAVNENIELAKRGRDMSGKKADKAARLGIVTSAGEDVQQTLQDLQVLKGKLELIGSYPELRQQAEMWDGESEVDPVGWMLQQQALENERMAAEKELEAEEYLKQQQAEATGELFSMSMTAEMRAIKAAAEKTGTFMKAPNGKQSNLNERQWLQVRTAAFKRWFGDWERAAELTFNVKNITQKEADAELMKLAQVLLLNDGEYGVPAEVNRDQREKLLSNTARRKSEANGFSKDEHFYLASRIRTLYKYAVCLGDYRDVNGARNVLAIRRFAAPFVVNGKRGYALLTVKITEQNHRQRGGVIVSNNEARAYSIELDELRGIDSQLQRMESLRMDKMVGFKKQFESGGTVGNVDVQDSPSPNSDQILEVFNAKVKEYFDNVSKIVDSNGEPLVVYHGTARSKPISIFKGGKSGYLGPGIYFTPEKRTASKYTGMYGDGLVYEGFVNMRNPLAISYADKPAKVILDAVKEGVYEKRIETQGNESQLLKKADLTKLRKKGYDGIVWAPMKALDEGSFESGEMLFFESNQIKSATDNRGTFDGSEADISMSMERNLAAVHTLSPEKFLSALELGGMPMPSVAVTRLDKPYGWGGAGNIMLVGRPAMVDPKKGTEVYSADAWTGKFPRVIHKHQENADFKEAAKAAGEIENKYGYVFYQLADKLRQADTRSDLQYLLETDNGKALFAYMHGYEPKARTMARQMDYEFLDKQFAKDTRNMWENGEAIKEGQELAFADAVEASLNRWLEGKEEKYRKLYGRLYGDLLSDLRSGRPYGVWFRLKMSLNNMGKRELNAHGNREMLAKYADKHKKAFAAWVNEKVDKWRSKEGYIRETGKVATLDNVLSFMLSKKGLNNEDFIGFSPGKLRAALSDKMRSLDDIKGCRERLSDSDTSKESKKQSEELMMEYTRMVRGHLAEAGADSFYAIDYGLESLSLVKGKPTVEKVQRAVRKVFSYTKAAEAMAKDNELLQAGVDAVTSVRAEIEDYMEAVPQRAVQMNEWEYAVMPESLKKNKAVMAGLRENGIRTRFHDGTEEGRKAALAGLVNDDKVSFSVVGEKAANWDKIKHLAFRGRDDGMLRVEIDASQARLKWEDLRGRNVAAYRRIVEGWDKLPDNDRKAVEDYAEMVYDWQDASKEMNNTPENGFLEQYNKVVKMRDAIKPKRAEIRSLLNKLFVEHGGSAAAVLNMKDGDVDELAMSLWGPYVESKVEDVLDLRPLWNGGMRLADVLDYPELYEAYPELSSVTVRYATMDNAHGRALYGDGEHEILINRNLEGEWQSIHSILLHEIQHHIQNIEGFAKGGNPSYARRLVNHRAEMGDMEALALRELSDMGLYNRIAGEIEARNVQARYGWSMDRREAIPFNDTLEYPGEALVSFSMQRVTQRSLELLESRSEEEVAQQIMEDLRKACERLSLLMADDGTDVRRGNGLRVYAEMQALLSAVRQALPEKYLKQGNLEMLLRWASVYAKMATDGEVPARGLIKGDVFDSFVAVLEKQQKQGQLQGMTAEESREALMELAGEKLEVAFMKVARDCVRRIDQFLKDRALERIEWVYQHAYPTREEGRAWGRGKMDSDNYRVVNAAWQLVQGSLNKRKEAEEEMRLVRRQMMKVREQMKGKEIEEGEGKRWLKKLNEQLGQLELAAMQAAAEQQAALIKSISEELESLDTDAADFSDKEAAANERMALQQTFGNWYYKDALEARRAARVFEDMVLRGKKQWEEKLKVEREEIAYWREQILSGFEVGREKATNTRMKQRNAVRTRLDKQLVGMGKGLMNFGHLMLALRPLLGRRFCDMKREQISQMHTNTMAFNTELKNWMFRTLRDITGLQTETEQELWLADQNQARDTGIVITERATVKAALTYAEAKRWLGMSVAEREKERARMNAEAAAAKRKPSNVPTEEMMEELGQLVSEYEKDNHGVEPQNKKFVVQAVEEWQTELHTTKDAILFGILTFEQPDYERLMEPNGITPEILDQMRRYVGPKMLRWGYAMREKLSEHGVNVARVFEEYTGIPFDSRENYFKGVFDQGALKEQTLEQAVAAASGASGTGSKYGSLIPRRYHMSKINWDTSAAGVFVTSMQQQNNYVQTSRMVRNWRALLTDKAFAARVEAEIGTAANRQIIGWLELIEGAVVADVKMAELSNRMMRRLMGGYAKASLGGNIRTLIKQVSALLNGYAGGYVPDKWMLNNELCQEMTYRKIGFGEYMMALARVLSSMGSVSRGETKQQAFIYARKAVEGDGLLRVTYLAANQKLPGQADGWLGQKEVPKGVLAWLGQKANKVVEKAMDAIAVVDAEMCTASAMAIADVAYRQAVAADVQNVVPDDVKRAEALRLAGMALDVAGQPQLRTQKSYWAASGALGGMGDFLFMFRSDTLSKAGLWIAQATSGEGKAAVGGWLAFGIMNSLVLAMLEGLRGNLGDEDDEWYQYAAAFGMNVLTNDATALPVVGEMLAKVRAGIMGEPVFQNGLSDLVPFGEVFEYGKREVKNIRKGASWDRHWNATAGLLRALGSSCAVCQDSTIGPLANLSSLTMAAAVFANSTKFVQGLIKLGEEVAE